MAKTASTKEAPVAKKAPATASRKKAPRERKPRPQRPEPVKPVFDLSLSINLDREFARVMRTGFAEAGKGVAAGFQSQLKIPAETEGKTLRELDRIRKNFSKIMEKAVVTFGTRTLAADKIKISELLPANENGNFSTPPMRQELSESFVRRHLGQFRNLLTMLEGEAPSLKRFPDLPEKLESQFGTSLENDYFLTGHIAITPNFAKPELSELSYAYDLFAKQGKKMGMRLQFSLQHDLTPDKFVNEVRLEIPAATPVTAPAPKKPAAKKPTTK